MVLNQVYSFNGYENLCKIATWTIIAAIGSLGVLSATNFYVSNMFAILMDSTVFLINVIAPLGSELFPINYKYVLYLFKYFLFFF